MKVFIPNAIYDECKREGESFEDFVRNIIREWSQEFLIATEIMEGAIKEIRVLDKE